MFQVPLIKVGFGCFNNNSCIKSFEMGKSKWRIRLDLISLNQEPEVLEAESRGQFCISCHLWETGSSYFFKVWCLNYICASLPACAHLGFFFTLEIQLFPLPLIWMGDQNSVRECGKENCVFSEMQNHLRIIAVHCRITSLHIATSFNSDFGFRKSHPNSRYFIQIQDISSNFRMASSFRISHPISVRPTGL